MNMRKTINSVIVIISLILFAISIASAIPLNPDRVAHTAHKISPAREVVVKNDCCEDLLLWIAWELPDGRHDAGSVNIDSCYYGYVRTLNLIKPTDDHLAVKKSLIFIRAHGDDVSYTGTEVIEDFPKYYKYGWKRHYLKIDKDGDYALNLSGEGCPRQCCNPRKCDPAKYPKACDCGCFSYD